MRVLLALAAVFDLASALWPAPHSLQQGVGYLRLSSSFHIDLDCSLSTRPPADLLAAVAEAAQHLQNDRQRPLILGRGETLRPAVDAAPLLGSLRLALSGATSESCDQTVLTPSSISEEVRRPLEERREGYCLDVPEDGSEAVLTAKTTLGLFRGLHAFSQLVYTLPRRLQDAGPAPQLMLADETETRYLHAPLHVEDQPAFPWRGFLLDTSRNFYPISALKRLILTASYVHLSQFHWHVTDSHAWPLVIPDLPALADKGAYDAESVYTPADVAELVAYANAHGVDVMFEIDQPGHTGSIGEAYPEHVACMYRQPWRDYAAEPGAGQLRIANADTVAFARGLLSSALTLAPGAHFSTGGDEVNIRCYDDDEPTQRDLKALGASLSAVLQRFTDQIHEVVRSAGRTPLIWEELALKQKLNLRKDTLVAVWTNSKEVKEVVKLGYRVVHAASDFFYLDCGTGGWLGGPLGKKNDGRSWCDPYKTWHKMYSFDPYASLSPEQRKLIMGGQVLLWSEQADETSFEPLFWPRSAAAAEVFWHGGGGDAHEALPRLHDLRERMRRRGVRAAPLQPLWCALRPGECDA